MQHHKLVDTSPNNFAVEVLTRHLLKHAWAKSLNSTKLARAANDCHSYFFIVGVLELRNICKC